MTTPSKQRAISAGTAAVVAGAAVAALQVVQQTVGAFDPRPAISNLIVVAAFFVGLIAARLRARRAERDAFTARGRHIHDLVGVWPAPRTADADALRLGVFPARRDAGTDPPYVARDVDDDLRTAMTPGAVVLLAGDPRAGASRTALAAARSALPDALVLAPRTPTALVELLALDPPLDLAGRQAVVWLDGLDRYAEVIDAECLDALLELAPGVTVIATIRRADWATWLSASGAVAEAARALVARARVFELAARLSTGELERARALYPDADLAAGIGSAIASGGRERTAPPARSAERRGAGERTPVAVAGRDAQLVIAALATCATLAGLAAVWGFSGFSIPPISEQLATVLREGSGDGRRASVIATGDLRGTGVVSRVVLYRDTPDTRTPRSDELRIYDEEGDTLKPRLQFRPHGERAVYRLRAAADVDGESGDEIVGAYAYGDERLARGAMVPFAINWDTGTGDYRLVALDLGAPTFSRRPRLRAEAQYRAVYAARTTFADPVNHLSISGHRVQDFAVTPEPRRMVTGWFLTPWLGADEATFELQIAIFDSSRGVPHLRPCVLIPDRGPLKAMVASQSRDLPTLFKETYAKAVEGRACQAQVG